MPNQPDLDPTVVIPLPQRTLAALDALENAGFETWIVGGYVRDALLGRPSSDIDIATQAHWQDVQRVFEGQGYRTHETGTAHGTLTVIVDEQALEVTTYRSDGAYADARHPNQVSFVRTIAEDLARRDFTMNALAYHPARGLFDPYGGHADLEAQIIRAVGDPDRRFSEDALRMLRACRFAAELGFAIDPNTFEGMLANKGLLPRISTQRITHELPPRRESARFTAFGVRSITSSWRSTSVSTCAANADDSASRSMMPRASITLMAACP